MSGRLAVAILAAGSARRFGGGKLDADCAGRSLGRWALEAARDLDGSEVAVVIDAPAPDFVHDAKTIWNLRAKQGLGTSVAAAAEWARSSDAEAVLIMLADMPLVSSATLQELAAGPLPSAVAYPDGKPGVPACFPAGMFDALAKLAGEAGAATLLRDRSDIRLVVCDQQELRDVDRPEDLAEVAHLLSSLRA